MKPQTGVWCQPSSPLCITTWSKIIFQLGLFLQNFRFINIAALQDWASFKHIYHLVTTPSLRTAEQPKPY